MKTPLIAGNSDRVMAKTISSQAQAIEKVQRPERELVQPSGWKWGAPKKGGDMVYSAKKFAAALGRFERNELKRILKYAFLVLDPRKDVRRAAVTLH